MTGDGWREVEGGRCPGSVPGRVFVVDRPFVRSGQRCCLLAMAADCEQEAHRCLALFVFSGCRKFESGNGVRGFLDGGRGAGLVLELRTANR